VVLIEPTGVCNTGFVEAQLTATPSDADGDPYGEFKRRYSETTHAMAKMRLLTFDTVAPRGCPGGRGQNPKPRYLVGASGKASVLARLLLTDRMWDRLLMRGLRS
jgi:hypothetical protein